MSETGTEMRLERRFDAPVERVFEAWTSPEVLRRWWAARPDFDCPEAEVDLRVGGRYRLAMRSAEGETRVVAGEYTAVAPPERLAYTWAWEGGEMGDTLVTVEFHPDGDGTRVVLTHSGFPDEREREMHGHGWAGCLDNLASRVLDA